MNVDAKRSRCEDMQMFFLRRTLRRRSREKNTGSQCTTSTTFHWSHSLASAKGHKVVHLPGTPKSHEGHTFALCQGPYNIGHHKMHITLQNEASQARLRIEIVAIDVISLCFDNTSCFDNESIPQSPWNKTIFCQTYLASNP